MSPSPTPEEHLVQMRDGTMLATDVYLPAEWTRGPVILTRTPYDKSARDLHYAHANRYAPHFVEAGYVVVIQDVRGKHRSGGATMPFVHEANDGYDTLNWISEQPWSDGRVGMFGASYAGITQWAAASSRHPALRALVPEQSTASTISDEAAGAGRQRPPVGLHWINYLIEHWVDQQDRELDVDWRERPSLTVVDRVFTGLGKRSAGVDANIPYAVPLNLFPDGHPFDRPALPALHIVGWFDPWAHLGLQTYLDLRELPAWAPTQHLLAESMDHYSYHLDDAPVEAGTDFLRVPAKWDEFRRRVIDPMVTFYDRYLKDDLGAEVPGARWHAGRVGYAEAPTWPPAVDESVILHLGAYNRAATTRGSLTIADPSEGGSAVLSHDPLHPLRFEDNHFSPLYHHRDESAPHDGVLAFESGELEHAIDLVGRGSVSLHVRSSAPNADVFVRLLDVDPSGAARLVARGEMTAIGVQNEARELGIPLSVTAYRFDRGHRIRLTLAGSDFPTYLPNAGTEENPWLVAEPLVAEHVISGSEGSAAILELPGPVTDRAS